MLGTQTKLTPTIRDTCDNSVVSMSVCIVSVTRDSSIGVPLGKR